MSPPSRNRSRPGKGGALSLEQRAKRTARAGREGEQEEAVRREATERRRRRPKEKRGEEMKEPREEEGAASRGSGMSSAPSSTTLASRFRRRHLLASSASGKPRPSERSARRDFDGEGGGITMASADPRPPTKAAVMGRSSSSWKCGWGGGMGGGWWNGGLRMEGGVIA